MAPPPRPLATYRVQLRAEFDFDAAAAEADYLRRLGVSHLYCSPYLQAAPGSTHGYDVVDHSKLSAELGGTAAHERLVQALTAQGLGQVLDVVPNHMAIGGRENPWWWDVLENGPASIYADCFDIHWWREVKPDPTVLAPVLGDHYGRVLEAGEIKLVREAGELVIRYYDHVLPLSPVSLARVLTQAAALHPSSHLGELVRMSHTVPSTLPLAAAAVMERHEHKEVLRERLADVIATEPDIAAAIDAAAAAINADADALDELLREQHYRLAYWRIANEEIDYRRFFNIESLVGLRVESSRVFDDSHRLILELVERGVVQGLRIDHIDGLCDPLRYLERLRHQSHGAWVVVEKILELDESLPHDWPVDGTTGYDFMASVNNLFVDHRNREAMDACYAQFVGEDVDYAQVVSASKQRVMERELRAELGVLVRVLARLCEGFRRQRDHTRRELREALMEFLASYDVYRTYVRPFSEPDAVDRQRVQEVLERTHARRPDIDLELLEWIAELALLRHEGPLQVRFALRLAQVSAPVMAKGVEDTAFYRYQRLISLNEVGGNPAVFGRSVAEFHEAMAYRAQRLPSSMLTLSTHDTKRSADVRARLHLLSELPEAFGRLCAELRECASVFRRGAWPDPHTEYMLYQTLVGAWPIDVSRLLGCMEKSVREAKVYTSWTEIDESYEGVVFDFCRDLLANETCIGVLERFLAEHRIVERGRRVSLAQTALLLTCPGIPDVYQGSELWDLSLMDPDNRRPVDYGQRRRLLEQLERGDPLPSLADDAEGVLKLALVRRLLQHRRERPDSYAAHEYAPLSVGGARAEHATAFRRRDLVVVVPRLVSGLDAGFGDTRVQLPPGRYRHLFGGALFEGEVGIDALLAAFPVAVLERDDD